MAFFAVCDHLDYIKLNNVNFYAGKTEWDNFTSYWKLHDINFSAKLLKSYRGIYLPLSFQNERYEKVFTLLMYCLHYNQMARLHFRRHNIWGWDD